MKSSWQPATSFSHGFQRCSPDKVRPNALKMSRIRVDVDWKRPVLLGFPSPRSINHLTGLRTPMLTTSFRAVGQACVHSGGRPLPHAAKDIEKLYVRNTRGDGSLFSFASSHWTSGSPRLERFKRVSVHEYPGRGGAGKSSVKRCRRWKRSPQIAQGIGLNGRAFYQEGPQVRRRPFCMLFPLSSSSCVWRPCMRAGNPAHEYADVAAGCIRCNAGHLVAGFCIMTLFQIDFSTTLGLTTKKPSLLFSLQGNDWRMEKG